MIIVSISSTEEKFVIQLKHKIDYMVVKKYRYSKLPITKTVYLFVHLFYSMVKLIYSEIFLRSL